MIKMDYNKVAKDINKRIKKTHCKDFIKKPNHKNEIFYNVQKYYILCMDIIAKDIMDSNYLYDYEYDIIVKKTMNRFKGA